MIASRREEVTGRLILLLLVVVTIIPFLSLFTTALYPTGSVPPGLSWPEDPQWGNFLEAFQQAHMEALLASSVLIVLGVVPLSVAFATMAGFGIGHLRVRGSRILFVLFLLGLTLPLAGIVIPLYYLVRELGIYDTKLAIILPLIGLYMPFGVFWMGAHFVNMPTELSEAARVDGATTGQLDPAAVFYLRSRGIGAAEARRMLIAAFAREIVGRIPVRELEDHVVGLLAARLPDLAAVGAGP